MTGATVGPWAREKLDCLAKYLDAYTKILRKQTHLTYIYIDAFSGAGRHRIRTTNDSADQLDLAIVAQLVRDDPEHQEFVAGSPRVALDIKHPFQKYIFIEQDSDRAHALEELKKDYFGPEILVRQDDCNHYIGTTLLNPKRAWANLRAVIFLDPFGMQVPWRTIERIGNVKHIEVIINFPVGMAIQRLLRRNAEFTTKQRRRLDQYFGSADWHRVVYERKTGLFGEITNKVGDSNTALTNWYRDRLAQHFRFVSSARLIRSTRKQPLYYLIHAGSNRTGARIADYILSQGEAV